MSFREATDVGGTLYVTTGSGGAGWYFIGCGTTSQGGGSGNWVIGCGTVFVLTL